MSDFQPTFESERRFLVRDPAAVVGAAWELITQAYLFSADGFAVRVRRVQEPIAQSSELTEGAAWLTGKGPRINERREEYETQVSPLWARQVIARCANVVVKRRYQLLTDQTWEVDEFLEHNLGLWIAEIEGGPEILRVRQPKWVASEIVNDTRFDNERLAIMPIDEWDDRERSALPGLMEP